MLTRTIVTLMTVAAISGSAVASAQAAPNAVKKFECYDDGNPKHFRPGCPMKDRRLVRAIAEPQPPTTPPPGSAPRNAEQPFDADAFFGGLQTDGGDGGGAGGGGGSR